MKTYAELSNLYNKGMMSRSLDYYVDLYTTEQFIW